MILAQIYPHLSKVRLLLETDDETHELYLQWVLCLSGTTT